MRRSRFSTNWILWLLCSAGPALADGMVFPEVYYPKAEIPNQQALIQYSEGIERLVIETSFLGEGTNFAWVVPLPAAPEVKPVSESFFANLQRAFQPRLVHRVNPYYAGVLLLCGLAFLGAHALRDQVSWVVDLPLCLLLAVGAGLVGGAAEFGVLALALALCIRLFARSPATYAVILLIGTAFAALLSFQAEGPHLIETMGGEPATEGIAGVTVVSVQHAGVFETTTLRGNSPAAVLQWLEHNGYQTPPSAGPAIRQYIERGWVFVASKARLGWNAGQLAALHPLAFTFRAYAPVYPTRLTAIADGNCSVALYVFGNRRATARHFSALRCDRLASGGRFANSGLRIFDPEVLEWIGNSTVGTKLFAELTPAQMASDVAIGSGLFWSKGRRVYSYSAALVLALNVALPLGALGWLLAGMSRGGWKVNERWISRWRWRLLAAAAMVGLALFLLLPKVEVETVNGFRSGLPAQTVATRRGAA